MLLTSYLRNSSLEKEIKQKGEKLNFQKVLFDRNITSSRIQREMLILDPPPQKKKHSGLYHSN